MSDPARVVAVVAALLAAIGGTAHEAAAVPVAATPIAFVGEAAPGLPGETFFQFFADVNDAGEVVFTGRLASFAQGVWRANGAGGEPEPVLLPGAASPLGPPGAAIANVFAREITSTGGIGYEVILQTGVAGVTSATDRILGTFTPGVGHEQVARDGDPAPGFPGATLLLDVTPDAIPTWNGAGQALQAISNVALPFVVGRALYRFDPGSGLTPIYRSGDPVPGDPARTIGGGVLHQLNEAGEASFAASTVDGSGAPLSASLFGPDGAGGFYEIARIGGQAPDAPAGATFRFFPGGGFHALNEAARIAFAAELTAGAGGVTSADDSGIWIADGPLDITLHHREGEPVPGAPGLVFGRFDTVPTLNDTGVLAITANLALGGTVTTAGDRVLLLSEGSDAVALVAREGEPNPLLPGEVWGGNFNVLGFGDTGELLFREGGADRYYHRTTSGELTLVAGAGVQLDFGGGDVRTLADLVDTRASEDARRLVGTARFTDGSSALVLLTVPEPGTALLTLLGLLGLRAARGAAPR